MQISYMKALPASDDQADIRGINQSTSTEIKVLGEAPWHWLVYLPSPNKLAIGAGVAGLNSHSMSWGSPVSLL